MNRIFRLAFISAVKRISIGRILVIFPSGRSREFDSGVHGPDAILNIHSQAFFAEVILRGEIGFGEAYQKGFCSSPDLVALIELAIRNRNNIDLNKGPLRLISRLNNIKKHRRKSNTVEQAKNNIHDHYDLGNDFFRLFLDETMTYSSALFDSADQSLKQAQIAKYSALANLAGVTASDQVLEIGTGWGGFAIHLAKTYGCQVTTVTISQEQHRLATERVFEAGLDDLIEVQLTDYREVTGLYDKVLSIEMFEAVGVEYFGAFFASCARALRPNGKLAMQVITVPDANFEAQKNGANWIQKYIFPGGVLPSLQAMEQAALAADLQLGTNYDIGNHYAKTLRIWREQFWEHIEQVKSLGFDQWFINTWDYYLAACEAGFATQNTGDLHVLFNKT